METLGVVLAVSIGLNIAVRRGRASMPPIEYFPDMARTARYNAFEANPNFADGMTLRVPPNGTIPRGMLPLASHPTTPAAIALRRIAHAVLGAETASAPARDERRGIFGRRR